MFKAAFAEWSEDKASRLAAALSYYSASAAGSLVVILIWIYYSAQILFFGVELTQVYTNKYGSKIRPAKDAIPVTRNTRAEQGLSTS
jgi:uncharacterized BrkB/YihY/UPF0761 family membrane protein